MNNRYYKDKKQSLINEIKFKAYMEHKLNRPIHQYKDRYAEIDFRDGKNLLELKGRFIKYKSFKTTMVGYNKIKKSRRKARKGFTIYFYFLFTDGLYRWKYNEDEIVCVTPVCRKDRGRLEIKDHAFINITDLEFITKKFTSIK